ncbi:Crp/Fnr family transcriptional regulator [Roseibium salinum]|nr:Crp/Fnr family transcriptional regulator [Roseibium salinum]
MAKDRAVFRSGDPVRSAYLVVAGQIDLVRHSGEGARMILHRSRSGQVVAEASVYERSYHCDGFAKETASLLAIPVTVFRDRLGANADLSERWAAHLAHSLQGARMQAEIRTLRTVSERLDAWLADARDLPPKGEWQDLAQLLGVTREALYRELARRRP